MLLLIDIAEKSPLHWKYYLIVWNVTFTYQRRGNQRGAGKTSCHFDGFAGKRLQRFKRPNLLEEQVPSRVFSKDQKVEENRKPESLRPGNETRRRTTTSAVPPAILQACKVSFDYFWVTLEGSRFRTHLEN